MWASESSDKAIALGIGMVHQRFKLVPSLHHHGEHLPGCGALPEIGFSLMKRGNWRASWKSPRSTACRLIPTCGCGTAPLVYSREWRSSGPHIGKPRFWSWTNPPPYLHPYGSLVPGVLRTLVKGGKTVIFITPQTERSYGHLGQRNRDAPGARWWATCLPAKPALKSWPASW